MSKNQDDTSQDIKMEPGEKELRQIFEKTTINNLKSIREYNEFTQKLVRELQEHVEDLDGIIRQYDSSIENIKKQLTVLQTKIFQGGS